MKYVLYSKYLKIGPLWIKLSGPKNPGKVVGKVPFCGVLCISQINPCLY